MKVRWPDKSERENYEIEEFTTHYERLYPGSKLKIIEKRERPDFFVKDLTSGDVFGVELTSVYLSDDSVPKRHMPDEEFKEIPWRREITEASGHRLVEAVREKVIKARQGYDTTHPLILSVYANEYECIHMDKEDWESLVKINEQTFDNIAPFNEFVLWPLQNGLVISVKPGQ